MKIIPETRRADLIGNLHSYCHSILITITSLYYNVKDVLKFIDVIQFHKCIHLIRLYFSMGIKMIKATVMNTE